MSRFIPTHVGNALCSQPGMRAMPVHPHARGERVREVALAAVVEGSSPRTWGTPAHGRSRRGRNRFIPTHVGNARWHRRPPSPRTVHPHARGERLPRIPRARLNAGSSPRTWGTPVVRECQHTACRFIPTHVGNAIDPANADYTSPVHPHARGERAVLPAGHEGDAGSSPRTWGTLRLQLPEPFRERFIPTHVGNAAARSRASPRNAVHPHARGERLIDRPCRRRAVGSSPRTWGTPPGWAGSPCRWRFIPTHVGNALP